MQINQMHIKGYFLSNLSVACAFLAFYFVLFFFFFGNQKGWGILGEKEQECGIRTPSPFQTLVYVSVHERGSQPA